MSSPWRISCNQEISGGGYLRPEGLSKCPLNKLRGNYPFADEGCTAHGHHQGQHGARLAPQWCNTPGDLRVALQAQHSRQVGTCCPGAQSVSISPTKASKPVQENVLVVCPGRGQRECHPRAHVHQESTGFPLADTGRGLRAEGEAYAGARSVRPALDNRNLLSRQKHLSRSKQARKQPRICPKSQQVTSQGVELCAQTM